MRIVYPVHYFVGGFVVDFARYRARSFVRYFARYSYERLCERPCERLCKRFCEERGGLCRDTVTDEVMTSKITAEVRLLGSVTPDFLRFMCFAYIVLILGYFISLPACSTQA